MTRERAVAAALASYDDERNGYFKDLAELIAVPTESQNPARLPELRRYCTSVMRPRFESMGYMAQLFENPLPGCGPVLLATRVEDPSLPTLLCYGHGDVVLGMEGRWNGDRDPWTTTHDGDRVYGRGVADNKGQHLAHMLALRTLIETRGRLGFNHKFIIEMGEENGSKGFREIVASNKQAFAADAYFASDGPRTEIDRPNITLGNRGCCNFDLVVAFREGGHHSGNWGGLLSNPGVVLAHALSTITDAKGRILVEAWRPELPQYVRECLEGVDRDGGPNAPQIDDDWGEPGLTRMEKISGWNSFEVLAFTTGNPERPVNAVPGTARASCQLRYVLGTDEDITGNLRRHLDAHGFENVAIVPPHASNSGRYGASRTDPRHPFAQWIKRAVEHNSNQSCGVLPNSGGSNITDIIQFELGIPFVWFPLSYASCSQHAPNEHIIKPLVREGLRIITSIYWDFGDEEKGYRQ